MDNATAKELKTPHLRAALSAYGERLLRLFREMASLSGTGIALNRAEFHSTVRLQQCDPRIERKTHWGSLPEAFEHVKRGGSFQPVPLISESLFLHKWLNGKPRPLLLLAPFGSGKSVVLETFALDLAADLKSWPLATIPPFVPLPVRLRAWRWYSKNEPEDFFDFLYRSQEVIAPPYDKDGRLTSDQIKLLINAKLLVPFFDGLDELPDAYTSGATRDPRTDAFRAIESLFRDSNFAVASRPGYGAEKRFASEDIHTLREFTSHDIRTFITHCFKAKGHGVSETAQEAYRTAPPVISHFLQRPLFLAAWCDCLIDAPELAIDQLEGLLDRLLIKTFDPQRMQESSVTKETIQEAKPALAALLLTFFTDSTFSKPVSYRFLVQQLPAHVLNLTKAAPSQLIRWLEKTGLLEPVGETHYRLLRTAIVEYLVGWYLAEGVKANAAGQRQFVEVFSRWIWRPDFHDTLDYAFAMLWHGTEAQRHVAMSVLEWAVVSGQRDRTRGQHDEMPNIHPQDDLARPFALAVLRWYALNSHPADMAIAAAQEAALSVARTASLGVWTVNLLHGAVLPRALLFAVIHGLVNSLADQLSKGLDALCEWHEGIRAAALRVQASEARELMWDFIAEHNRTQVFPLAKEGWEVAIAAAAARIDEDDATALVKECIAEHDKCRTVSLTVHSFYALNAWRVALGGAASRVPENEAAKLMWHLIADHNGRRTDIKSQSAWQDVISAVGGRVREDESCRLIHELVAEISNTESNVEAEGAWISAIEGTARRVPPCEAAGLIRKWIIKHNMKRATSSVKKAWRTAILGAAEHVHEDDAKDLIWDLIAECQKRPIASELESIVSWNIETLAGKVRKNDAGELVRKFFVEYNKRQTTDRMKSLLRRAVVAAAGQVCEGDAVVLVDALFAEHNKRRATDTAKAIWSQAIAAAAVRIPEDKAAKMIEIWISEHNKRETAPQAQLALRKAIRFAAECVHGDDVPHVMSVLSAESEKHRAEPGVQKEWHDAIWATALRTSARDVLSVCNAMTQDGRVDIALHVAMRGTEVAIVRQSEAATFEGKIIHLRKPSPFVARARNELALDLVDAPELVHKLLNKGDSPPDQTDKLVPANQTSRISSGAPVRAPSENETLLALWSELSPEQRLLLEYIGTNEAMILNYTTLSLNFTLPNLPGAYARIASERRPHFKKIRAWCKAMSSDPLKFVKRTSEKGTIQLTQRGRRVLELVKNPDRGQLSE